MNPSTPFAEDVRGPRQLASIAAWTMRFCWAACPALLAARLAAAAFAGIVPVGLVVGAKMIVDTLQEADDVSRVVPWVVGIAALSVLNGALQHVGNYAANRMSDLLRIDVNLRVLRHAAELELAFFEDRDQQDALTRVRQTASRACDELVRQMIDITKNALQLVAMMVVIASIEPLVLAVLAVIALPYAIALWRLSKSQYWLEHDRVQKLRWTNHLSSRIIGHGSVPEIKLLGLAPLLLGRIAGLLEEFARQNRTVERKRLLIHVCFATLTGLTICLLAVRATTALNGTTTIGSVVAFLIATERVFRAASGLIAMAGRYAHTALKVGNLRAFLERVAGGSEAEDHGGDEATASRDGPRDGPPELELSDVVFTYAGGQRPVLKGVSLKIEPGETVALVGVNGAGKSTLVKLLGRLYQPDSGRILLNGRDLSEFSRAEFVAGISFLLQSFGRYEATVSENIAYGDWTRLLPQAEAVRHIAGVTGVADMIEALPQGYETVLGRSFGTTNLSGGQWRSLAIARACTRDVPLLVLDEPTCGLDPDTEHRILRFFREFLRGKSALIISHRLSTVRLADRIVVLDGGQIVESGTHDELLARQGRYARFFKVRHQMLTNNPLDMATLG